MTGPKLSVDYLDKCSTHGLDVVVSRNDSLCTGFSPCLSLCWLASIVISHQRQEKNCGHKDNRLMESPWTDRTVLYH